MKKIIFVCAIFIGLTLNSYAQQVDKGLENYFKLQESAVSLMIYFTDNDEMVGNCSGIIITKDDNSTGILTAKHCVPDNTEKILINNEYEVTKYILAEDIDVAYLEISTSLLRFNPINLAYSNAHKDDWVYFLGYPGFEEYFTIGKVFQSGIKNQYILMTSIGGCSGSGVVNTEGHLIGILWGESTLNLFEQKVEITVIIPIESIRSFLIKNYLWNKVRFE